MQPALLLQLLAARQGGADNPALQDMLARLQSGDPYPEADTKDMLARLEQTNPTLAALFQQMSTKKPVVVETARQPEFAEPRSARQDYYEESHESALALAEDLRTQAQTATQDLALYAERVDRCAAALGACGLCWGDDADCRACRGRGKPGFSLPDDALFEELIVPAIRMVRSHRHKAVAPAFVSRVPLTPSN